MRSTITGARSFGAAQLLPDATALQHEFFADWGIILLLLRCEDDEAVASGSFVLVLDGRMLTSQRWPTGGERASFLRAALSEHAADFLVPPLIERYLHQLAYPELVRAVRLHFTTEELASHLREEVASGASIRDFRGVLENLLQSQA